MKLLQQSNSTHAAFLLHWEVDLDVFGLSGVWCFSVVWDFGLFVWRFRGVASFAMHFLGKLMEHTLCFWVRLGVVKKSLVSCGEIQRPRT